jgi:hypothetical protein
MLYSAENSIYCNRPEITFVFAKEILYNKRELLVECSIDVFMNQYSCFFLRKKALRDPEFDKQIRKKALELPLNRKFEGLVFCQKNIVQLYFFRGC